MSAWCRLAVIFVTITLFMSARLIELVVSVLYPVLFIRRFVSRSEWLILSLNTSARLVTAFTSCRRQYIGHTVYTVFHSAFGVCLEVGSTELMGGDRIVLLTI